ncbi:MAG: hypothetical protein HC936_16095 [Leptolyngbyaceae cyanobacterium SU_3_3]|nr:hypothetical protein [Leptolyngbyaceae cyanobacterium SU_3_3]
MISPLPMKTPVIPVVMDPKSRKPKTTAEDAAAKTLRKRSHMKAPI